MELLDASAPPVKCFGDNVTLCVRESNVTVTLGGPDIVYVTAVDGLCCSAHEDEPWASDSE